MGTGTPGVSASAEGADMQEATIGKGAAQVVKVVAHHPASLVEDGPSPFVDSLWHGDVDGRMYVDGPRDDGRWWCGC